MRRVRLLVIAATFVGSLVPAGPSRAADPVVRYLPMPLSVEGKVVRTDIYLEASVDDRPAKMADRAVADKDYKLLADIVEAAKKKDAAAYAPLTWANHDPRMEIEMLRGYRSVSKVTDVSRRFDFGDVRCFILQQDVADKFLPVFLQTRNNETRALVSVMPQPVGHLLHDYARRSFQDLAYAPVAKVDATQQLTLPVFSDPPAGKVVMHVRGTPILYQVGGKDPPRQQVPERLMPAVQFVGDHFGKLAAGDKDGFLARLAPEGRKQYETALADMGPNGFKQMAVVGRFVQLRYAIESGDLVLLFGYGTPAPKPGERLGILVVRPREAGGFESVGDSTDGPLRSVLELPDVARQIAGGT